jgi:penicillin-insensitive murein endopeptidase
MRLAFLTMAALVLGAAAQAGDERASGLFAGRSAPAPGAAAPHGSHHRGCLAGAVALPETGPYWQAMRLSRNRHWGHPATIAFIGRLGRRAAAAGWPRLLVGDIGQPRGGPMPGGHRSHQLGLDADIWLRLPGPAPLSRAAREELASVSVVRADRLAVNGAWRAEHAALIRLAAEDPAVERVFVNPAIKRALCQAAPAADSGWLRKVRPWWGHDSHIHVRLACPEGAAGCLAQGPPSPGDGCGAELDWWFTAEALDPPRPSEPPAELTLADLPPACRALALE